MTESDSSEHWELNPDALFCALVLAPESFPRNRYFRLYEQPELEAARRRAKRVRGIVEQLLGQGPSHAEVVGEQVMADGQVLLSYRVNDLSFERTTALCPLDAAALRYALYRAGAGSLGDDDRVLVRGHLRQLGQALEQLPEALRAEIG